jgi:hypothetical protein
MEYLYLSDARDQDVSCGGVDVNHSVDPGSVDLLKDVVEVYVQNGRGSTQYHPDEVKIAVKEFALVE